LTPRKKALRAFRFPGIFNFGTDMTKINPISYDVRAAHGTDSGQSAYWQAGVPDSGLIAGAQGSGIKDRETRGGCVQIRVIVADDHPVVLAGVQAVLERAGDIKVVGEAQNGHELIELLKRCPCDVIVTDFSMPRAAGSGDEMTSARLDDGLPLIVALASRFPGIPVIVQTMVNNVGVLRTLQNQGVLGLADKRAGIGELVHAVRAVINGKSFVSKTLRERFEQTDMEVPTETTNVPSPREMEVLRKFIEGTKVTDIANDLNRSVKTVSTQKRQAMKKLGLKSDQEIMAYAVAHGLK
jgi:two-component system capsular synthesis response regulator RcsB